MVPVIVNFRMRQMMFVMVVHLGAKLHTFTIKIRMTELSHELLKFASANSRDSRDLFYKKKTSIISKLIAHVCRARVWERS